MTTEAVLREALRNYAEAKNRHDVEAIVAAYAPDGSYQDSGVRQPVTGHAQLRKFYAAFFQSVPDYQGHFDGTAFGDDTAVVWGRMTGTVGNNLLGLTTNHGSRFDVPVTFVCTFRGGQLTSDCGYFDTRILRHQVGLAGAAAAPEPSASTVASFVAGWARFWAAPTDATMVRGLVTDDVALHWPGIAEPLRGRDAYVAQLAAAVKYVPDLTLSVADYAHRGDVLLIAWEGRGTVGGALRRWCGADRFRLRDGQSAETTVVFDTRVMRPSRKRHLIPAKP